MIATSILIIKSNYPLELGDEVRQYRKQCGLTYVSIVTYVALVPHICEIFSKILRYLQKKKLEKFKLFYLI